MKPAARSPKRPWGLAAVVGAVLAAGGFVAFLLSDSHDAPVTPAGVGETTESHPASAPVLDEAASAQAARRDGTSAVEISLWHAPDFAKDASGNVVLGAGRTCSLTGRVYDAAGGMAGVAIRIIAGLNAGARVFTNAYGLYEIPNLYPGAAIVEFESPSLGAARRDVTLFSGQENEFEHGFLQMGNIHGTVVGYDKQPLEYAVVEVDGKTTETDKDGHFFFNGVVPGNAILYFSAPGCALKRASVNLRPGAYIEYDQATFVMQRSEQLVAQVGPLPLHADPPMLVVLPANPPGDFSFPFERACTVTAGVGEENIKVGGLPIEMPLLATAYADWGVPRMRTASVRLLPGDTSPFTNPNFQFAWKGAVSGVVTAGGKPVPHAKITVESSNIATAMEWALRDSGGLRRFPVPVFPCARKEAVAGYQGEFRVEVSDVLGPACLVAEAPGFDRKIVSIPSADGGDLGDLQLMPEPSVGPARISFEFDPVGKRRATVYIDGKLQSESDVEAGDTLEIPDMPPGLYTIRVRDAGRVVLADFARRVRGVTVVRVSGAAR